MDTMTHNATVKHSSDRVLDMNYKTGQKTKTVAWHTTCTCGFIIETKGNNRKSHINKVTNHNKKAGN